MADISEVNEGDRVRIVFEGVVRTKVKYSTGPRVDLLFKPHMGDDPSELGAGVFWFDDEFVPELTIVKEKESE